MIKKFFLPDSSVLFQAGITDPGYSELARHSFTAPMLPFLHEDWQRFGIQFRPAKEMHMIRHDDVAPNRPPMATMRITPFLQEYRRNLV